MSMPRGAVKPFHASRMSYSAAGGRARKLITHIHSLHGSGRALFQMKERVAKFFELRMNIIMVTFQGKE